jgi:hypothetical protein
MNMSNLVLQAPAAYLMVKMFDIPAEEAGKALGDWVKYLRIWSIDKINALVDDMLNARSLQPHKNVVCTIFGKISCLERYEGISCYGFLAVPLSSDAIKLQFYKSLYRLTVFRRGINKGERHEKAH